MAVATAETSIALSINIPNEIRGPSFGPASWLASVERRIRNSIVPHGREVENDGRWLSYDIANAATSFFQTASDVLPSEPYIYSSLGGDLVAEFKAEHGTMTSVISDKFLVSMVVVDGEPIETRIEFGVVSPATIRRELTSIMTMLRTGKHGKAMGPSA
jgi:hypothetical protein